MRPARLPTTALLASLTALALLGAAAAIRPPGPPAEADGAREAANRALAYAFYDAVNGVIATGDPTPLAALVSPDFVDRGTSRDAEPDRDGLFRRLRAIHAAAPDVRLAVEAIAADGDLVIAHVRVNGATSPTFLGLRLDDDWTPWGPVDAFRVEDDQIVERRGEAVDPVPAAPLVRVTLDVSPPEARALAVARVSLAPGARFDATGYAGPRLLFVEAGAVAVEPTGPGATPPVALAAGEHLVLPPGAGFAVAPSGPAPAVFLDFAVAALPYGDQPGMPAIPSPHEGVTVQIVADELLISVPTGPAVLAIGRTTLESSERLGWAAADGAVLLHVEAGTLDLTATGSVPWVGATTSERSNAGLEASLGAGGGALLDAGAAAEIRAAPAGPVTLLIVTLLSVV